MGKIQYQWRELELVSITTISNIITFIQFAIIPLDLANSENKVQEGNSFDKIEKFITLNFGAVAKLFTAPFDFIRTYSSIAAPVRTALSATIVFALIEFLYTIFFLPSWRFILLFLDLFMPAAFLFGIIFIARKYEDQKKNAIILIICGLIYLVVRLIYFISPIFRRKGWKWYIKCANRISDVFSSRLKKDKEEDVLDAYVNETHKQVDMREHSLQFDKIHFSFKTRLIDTAISFVIWLILLIFLIMGWQKVLEKTYKGKQLSDLVSLCKIITLTLFIGMCLRLLISCAWLARPMEDKIFNIFKKLKGIAYKGMLFLTGIVLLPILKMVLSASATTEVKCNWYQYYDFRSNTDSFLQYFMARKSIGCVNCSKYSANHVSPCNSICYYEPEQFPLLYKVLIDSGHISETELTDVFLIPTVLLEIFYLAIFIQLLRQIYCTTLDILTFLPGPTKNVECKFQTLIYTLTTSGVATFRSYRYKSALYYFTFTQSKLFVLFLTSLLTVIPIDILKENSQRIIPWIYFLANIIISASQMFSSPYVSILHNIINFVSYLVSGIASLVVGLHVCEIIKMPSVLGNLLFIIIIIAPIATALITPFFARRDKFLVPTQYDLVKIVDWDSKLNKNLRRKRDKARALQRKREKIRSRSDDEDDGLDDDILYQDEESSVSISYFNKAKKKKDQERPHDQLVGRFNLIKLAPIEVQEGIKYTPAEVNGEEVSDNENFRDTAREIWPKVDIEEENFDRTKNEMLDSSNKLIDCIAYNNLMRLLNLSIIISSACLGWCLSSGIVQWQRVLGPDSEKYYLRCNAFNNGTYPAYGTY